ncbi:DUF1203 domain-containing protein [Actinosynnema sp. NPDC020468]|uniref:DUF1203 domain-containing protein n=1 Tax=Actinosynnema sp. NPDC020468 TaxID=3154488 RepID=UPI0033C46769
MAEDRRPMPFRAARLEPMKIHALPSDVLTAARDRAGTDEFTELRPSEPGAPLRCCLRKAVADEPVVLFRYAPTAGRGPYAESGPVFAHFEPCAGPDHTDRFPEAFAKAPRLLRAYNTLGRIETGTLAAPEAVNDTLVELFNNPTITEVQIRSASHGCYLFSITPE